jgi:hypothetical protein
MRNRLDPDYLTRVQEYAAELFSSLKRPGKSGPFWTPEKHSRDIARM